MVAGARNCRYLTRIMKARVTVTLKAGILDPQGKAIEGALKSLRSEERRVGKECRL